MNHNKESDKIIDISNRINSKRDRKIPGNKGKKKNTRVIAVTSGKGGVGKTNIVANLGIAFSRLGKDVMALDADLGLGNLDVLLGLTPKYNLSHVIMGEKEITEIILNGPENIKIIPASSGIQELTHLTTDQKVRILTQLDLLIDSVDILLIDTAAGISANVMDFNMIAHEIMVVVTPEPTSLTDAYALMKVLSMKYMKKHCKLMVNLARSMQEGYEISRQLSLVADRFLEISVEYVGCILFDEKVTQCVKRQKMVSELYPDTSASRCFSALAEKVSTSPFFKTPIGDSNLFWEHLVGN